MVKCSACGVKLPADAVYCYECGRKVKTRVRKTVIAAFLLVTALIPLLFSASIFSADASTTLVAVLAEEGFKARVEGAYVVVDADGLDVGDFEKLLSMSRGAIIALEKKGSPNHETAPLIVSVLKTFVSDALHSDGRIIAYLVNPTGYQVYRVFQVAGDTSVIVIIQFEK